MSRAVVNLVPYVATTSKDIIVGSTACSLPKGHMLVLYPWETSELRVMISMAVACITRNHNNVLPSVPPPASSCFEGPLGLTLKFGFKLQAKAHAGWLSSRSAE